MPSTQDAAIMDGCGACPSCSRIARGVHPDVVFLEPGETGAIKIDAVRDAIERSAYRPFEGKRRVVIADDAEAMVPEAQNAMLKTLEEPPLGSTFILVSSRPDMLLPTVRSRCQQLRFGRLAAAEIAGLLMRSTITRRPRRTRRPLPPTAASAGRSRAVRRSSSTRASRGHAADRVGSRVDPRRRLEGAGALPGGSGDRDELARRLRAPRRCCGTSVSCFLARTNAARERRPPAPSLSGSLRSFDGERALRAFSAVDRALSKRWIATRAPKIVADWLAFQI